MRIKRYTAGLLAVLIMFLSIATINVYADVDYASYKSVCIDRMTELQDYSTDSFNGQYGLIYKLQIIDQYAMHVDYLYQFQTLLGVQSAEMVTFCKVLKNMCDDFDAQFNKESSKFIQLGLLAPTLKNNTAAEVRTWICNTLIQNKSITYLKTVLDDSSLRITELSELEKRQTVGVLASSIYSFMDALLDEESTLASMTPYDENNVRMSYSMRNYPNAEHSMAEGLSEIKGTDAYKEILTIGEDIAVNEDGSSLLLIDNSKENYVENLADVVAYSGGLQIPEDPQLTLAYLAILSASAVYSPMQSYVGCSEFTRALSSLCSDSTAAEELVAFYNATKDFRKPLYKRKLNDEGAPTGAATLLTIADFFTDIENGSSGSLCTVDGNLVYDSESGCWVYQQEVYSDNSESVENGNAGAESIENTNSDITGETEEEDAAFAPGTSFLTDLVAGLSPVGIVSAADSDEINTDTAVPSSKTITDENRMTGSLFLYGAEKLRDVDNMTTVVMNNILKNTVNLSSIENKSTRYIYVNAYGDIVTDDNLVIFPGAANPMLYNEGVRYNPFTVAFMNSYPTILNNTSSFQLASKNDIGKYILMLDSTGDSDSEIASQINSFNAGNAAECSFIACMLTDINNVKTSAPISAFTTAVSYTANSYESYDLFSVRRLIFGSNADWDAANSKMYSYTPLVMGDSITVNDESVFPYSVTDDSSYAVASSIVLNFYNYLTRDTSSAKVKNLGKLCDNWILHYFIMSGLGGTNNPEAFASNSSSTYANYVEGSSERRGESIKQISQTIFDKTTSVDGVIGLRSTYQDEVLGNVFQFIRANWIVFFVALLLFLIVAFAKVRRDLLQTAALLGATCFAAFLFVAIIPTYLPSVFNVAINNVAENFTYEVLATKTEYYDTSETSTVAVTSDGQYKFNTTSLTLFRSSSLDLDEFYTRLGIDASDVVAGKTHIVNPESGLFVEGDALKINSDLLFSTLHVYAENDRDAGVYQFVSNKTVSSNTDYYVPYYQFVDSFIGKLNTLARVYRIPRETTTYANGESKENYLVYSYVNSEPFLTPGVYGMELPADQLGWAQDALEEYAEENSTLVSTLTSEFGENVDWLGISTVLLNVSDYKGTLWAQTLQKNGYYDEDWKVNETKMADLITYVNYQTKNFVYDMSTQIGSLSDDVMIKMISLRALIAFTQEASQYGSWMYPYSLNYEELTLKDVLTCVFTDDYTTFVSMDMNIIDYVYNTHGMLHLVVFDVLIIVMFIITYAVRLLVSLTYLLLGFLVLAKLGSGGDIKLPMKGYLKCMTIVMFCATLLCIGVCFARKANGSVIAIYLLLALCAFIAYLILFVVTSIVANLADLGNTAIDAKIGSTVGNIGLKSKEILVRSTNVKTSYQQLTEANSRQQSNYDRYALDGNARDFYARGHSRPAYNRDWAGAGGSSYGSSGYEQHNLARDSASRQHEETVVDTLVTREDRVTDSGSTDNLLDL